MPAKQSIDKHTTTLLAIRPGKSFGGRAWMVSPLMAGSVYRGSDGFDWDIMTLDYR
jgi:hypothetical protein